VKTTEAAVSVEAATSVEAAASVASNIVMPVEYTRGHLHKLLKSVRYDRRKYYFTERIVNMWNSLPDAVVNSTVSQFKNRLDRHW